MARNRGRDRDSEEPEKVEEKPKRTLPKAMGPYRIQKGEVLNPMGAGRKPKIPKRLRIMTRKQLVEIGNMVIQVNVAELRRVAKDERNSSALKVMLASLVLRVVDKGDVAPLEMLLNRILGKVPDESKWAGTLTTSLGPQVIVTMPSNGRESKLVEATAAQAGRIIEAERVNIEEQEIPEKEPWL